jgi:hypothetical protein
MAMGAIALRIVEVALTAIALKLVNELFDDSAQAAA